MAGSVAAISDEQFPSADHGAQVTRRQGFAPMELRQLEYFAAVARHGHFGRAADEVYVTQSALAQQIARLEAELGLSLLVRTAKGVELTPAGAELLEHAAKILAQVARARAGIDGHRGAIRGSVRLAATSHDSAGMSQALVAFHQANPEVRVSFRHCRADDLLDLLGRGAIDAGLLGIDEDGPALPPGTTAHWVREEPLRLVCSPDDPLAQTDGQRFEVLRGVPVILPERGTALRELVIRSCQDAGFSPIPLLETSDRLTIRGLAAAGLGYGTVPESWLLGDGPKVGAATFAEHVPSYRVALVAGRGLSPVAELLVRSITEPTARPRTWPPSSG